MNEIDKFFGDLPSQDKQVADIFNDKKPEESATEKVVDKNEDGESEPHKNRRHRRLEEALQRERESNIALNERIKTLAEIREEGTKLNQGDIDARLIQVFGDSDVGKQIARNFSQVLSEETERAKREMLEEIESRQSQVVEEQKQYESFIDEQLEDLEDRHNVDLTSDAPQARKARREFLELVQNLSPKNESGELTDYADFDSTFSVYQKTRTEDKSETTNRQKEIAARSMQRSGSAGNNGTTPPQQTPGFRGWMKDYGVGN